MSRLRLTRAWRWAMALIPVAVGGLVSAVLAREVAELPSVYLAADLAGLAWVSGALVSVAFLLALAGRVRAEGRCADRVAAARARAVEERQRFVRRLDHELKNPLTTIHAGMANVAAAATDAERSVSLQNVGAQTRRIGKLVADLRKLAELETRSLDFAPVNVAEVLSQAADSVDLAGPAAASGIAGQGDTAVSEERTLTVTVPQAPWPLPEVLGDEDLLFLAVYNLLSNAVKFSDPGDRIEVRAFEAGNEVVIEVADTGRGIPPAEQPLVWEELYRAEAARGLPGSGLGLPLVRAIVARHGGTASLRSRVGQGTVVTLRLPEVR